MIDPNLLRNNLAEVAEKLKVKRNFILDTEKLTALEEQRKDLQVKTETLQAERNARSKAIGAAKARGEDIAPLLAEVDNMGEQLNEAKTQLDAVLAEINQIALSIPNIPADEVPLGKDDTENKEILLQDLLKSMVDAISFNPATTLDKVQKNEAPFDKLFDDNSPIAKALSLFNKIKKDSND